MFRIERFVIDLVAPSKVFTDFSHNGGPLEKYFIYGRGMFCWLGARTVLLCGGIVNQYAWFLTADLSYVTGGTKPDNQAEEEEDWEEGGVVQWHCRQRAPGKKVFKVWVHLIYQHTLKSNQCSCYFSMLLLNAVEKCCHSRDCVNFFPHFQMEVDNIRSPVLNSLTLRCTRQHFFRAFDTKDSLRPNSVSKFTPHCKPTNRNILAMVYD